MFKKIAVVLVALTIIVSTLAVAAQSQITVGVKVGHWIEYNIITTGTPISGHDITSARLEIIEVQGTAIKANVTSRADNGTVETITRSFNLAEGDIQAWVIIPANLGPGDSFYDASSNSNITIQGENKETFAGATRTITFVNFSDRQKQWDKTTGVFVTTKDILSNYTVSAIANATNMWSPQILGLDQTVFYVVIGVVVVVVIALIAVELLIIRRKRIHRGK
jgi:hypothetical protein